MTEYQFPVKAIKMIMLQELEERRQGLFNSLAGGLFYHDMLMVMFRDAREILEDCQSYEDIQEYLNHYDFRLSIQEWIESL